MKQKILVLGGTRYFGKRLVERLLELGHAVTLANRGQTPDPFGDRVARVVTDRTNLRGLPAGQHWDVVVDQIAYAPDDAAVACEKFAGRVGRYVYTSTQSVYATDDVQREADFDSAHYPLRGGRREEFDYSEGKRLTEAHFIQKAPFPVVAMRIPIVLGPDDYTGRLVFHVQRVREQRPLVVPRLDSRVTFISSEEAARFLEWLTLDAVGARQTGPLNACATGHPTMREVLDVIERAVGQKARILAAGPDADHTPFADARSRCLSNEKASALGFRFSLLESWLPELVSRT